MGVKLVASGGGSVEINPPSTSSNFTATMPAGTGSVVVNGVNGSLVLGTAQNSTSGTSIDFTGIPSWVERITVMFTGVSVSGTSLLLFQLGAGSVTTSGYTSSSGRVNNSNVATSVTSTAGFVAAIDPAAASLASGHAVFTNLTGNTWVYSVNGGCTGNAVGFFGGGNVALGGVLDRVRITTVNGTDTFDAGSINIMYE